MKWAIQKLPLAKELFFNASHEKKCGELAIFAKGVSRVGNVAVLVHYRMFHFFIALTF